MGIMTRQRGTTFVITSDRSTGEARTKKAPKRKSSDTYEVWTGEVWSALTNYAKTFETLEDGDEYIRAHFAQVTSQD